MRRTVAILKVLVAAAVGYPAGAVGLLYLLREVGLLNLINLLPEEISLEGWGAHSFSSVQSLVLVSLIPITSVLFYRFILRGGNERLGKFLGNLVLALIVTPIAWMALVLVLIIVVNTIGQANNQYFGWDMRYVPGWLAMYSFNTLCLVIYHTLAKPAPAQKATTDDSWRDR